MSTEKTMDHADTCGATYTPGPWVAEVGIGGRQCDWQIYPPHDRRDDAPLADVYTEADASLVAAAPEMVEALWEARKFVWCHADKCDLLNQIDAALSKALGTPVSGPGGER